MKFLFVNLTLLLFCSKCFPQIRSAEISIVDFSIETLYRIHPQDYYRIGNFADSLKVVTPQEINELSCALKSLHDTVFIEDKNDRIVTTAEGHQYVFHIYPPMDTRGKIVVYNSDETNQTYYISRHYIWNATDDILYMMTNEFENYINLVALQLHGYKFFE